MCVSAVSGIAPTNSTIAAATSGGGPALAATVSDLAAKLTQITAALAPLAAASAGAQQLSAIPTVSTSAPTTTTSADSDVAGANAAPSAIATAATPVDPGTGAIPGSVQLAVPAAIGTDIATAQRRALAAEKADAASSSSEFDSSIIADLGAGPSAATTTAELAQMRAIEKQRSDADAKTTKRYADGDGFDYLEQRMEALVKSMPKAKAAKVRKAFKAAKKLASHATSAAKKHFDRTRPANQAGSGLDPSIATPKSKSFPSGHTSHAFAYAEVLAEVDPANANTYRDVAQQVAYSRVVGGVHYPSDIVAGSYVGTRAARRALEQAGL